MVDVDFDPGDSFEQMEYDEVEFHERLQEEIDSSLDDAANIILKWLITFTPVRTGTTAASWQVIAANRDDYYITNTNEPVISFLTEGTAPHGPVFAQALHWVDPDTGEDIFAKWVRGIMPTPIEDMAMEEADPELEQLWDMAIDAANRETLT
jgi:hypothetical protein